MTRTLLQTYGLKFHPFRPDVPIEALYVTPTLDAFLRRVELSIADGGYVMITGDPGTGKSVALRLLKKRLDALRDVVVGIIEHPQSRISDFYREVGDLFGVPLHAHNRFAGFKAIRSRWTEHISTTCSRPVLILDEAQEVIKSVFCELRVLASKDLDSRQLLCVILAGDQRLPERLRSPELLPLGSRIRRRLVLEAASSDQLLACLEHLLAHNPDLCASNQDANVDVSVTHELHDAIERCDDGNSDDGDGDGCSHACAVEAGSFCVGAPSACFAAPTSCLGVLEAGATASGTYTIDPDGAGAIEPLEVHCDLETDGGGYTFLKVAQTLQDDAAEAFCADRGMRLFIPRTQAHLRAAVAIARNPTIGADGSDAYLNMIGVYPDFNGATCTGQPLNSVTGNRDTCRWGAGDGFSFFIHDGNFGEPNGDN